ncbi:MAG: nucleotidyltransferase domain-containing protein [Candidatus Bathycorpusculaceae bacterium]
MGQKSGHLPEKLNFITPTMMTVFDLFLTNPMQQYHEREVVRRTGVSKGSANKMLKLLTNLDFLIRERKGKMAFYRLDMKDPVVRQFKVLINIFALKNLLDSLKRHSRRIVLFGSCSQGIDVKQSDIDIFILALEKSIVRRKISEFNSRNEKKIAPIIIDATEFARLRKEDKPLYENIERGIVLWEAE